MKSEFKQEELIREYVREALVLEYAPPGAMGAALKRAVSEPTRRLASVISGKSKQVFASLKNLAKISWGALKELGTLGLLSASSARPPRRYGGCRRAGFVGTRIVAGLRRHACRQCGAW